MKSRFYLEMTEEKKKIVEVILIDDVNQKELDISSVLCDFADINNYREHIFFQYAISGEDLKMTHRMAVQFLALGRANETGFSVLFFELYLKTIDKKVPQFATDFPLYNKLIELYAHLGIENSDIDFKGMSEFEKDTLIKMKQISMVIELPRGDNKKTIYCCENLQDIVIALFYQLLKLDYTFKRCQNCGKRFVPMINKNEEYCNRKSPQYSEKTCKEANIHLKSLERVKSSEVQLLEKRVYNLYRTASGLNDDKAAAFEKFKQEKAHWKTQVRVGNKTEAEYIEWLKTHYARKYC